MTSTRRERLVVDLARAVVKYGPDEFLTLARDLRDPAVAEDLATLLERVAAAVVQAPRSPRPSPRKSAKNARRRGAVRAALREGYPTVQSLEPLLSRIGINPVGEHIGAIHDSIISAIYERADAADLEAEILASATRSEGELDRLASAIVSKDRS